MTSSAVTLLYKTARAFFLTLVLVTAAFYFWDKPLSWTQWFTTVLAISPVVGLTPRLAGLVISILLSRHGVRLHVSRVSWLALQGISIDTGSLQLRLTSAELVLSRKGVHLNLGDLNVDLRSQHGTGDTAPAKTRRHVSRSQGAARASRMLARVTRLLRTFSVDLDSAHLCIDLKNLGVCVYVDLDQGLTHSHAQGAPASVTMCRMKARLVTADGNASDMPIVSSHLDLRLALNSTSHTLPDVRLSVIKPIVTVDATRLSSVLSHRRRVSKSRHSTNGGDATHDGAVPTVFLLPKVGFDLTQLQVSIKPPGESPPLRLVGSELVLTSTSLAALPSVLTSEAQSSLAWYEPRVDLAMKDFRLLQDEGKSQEEHPSPNADIVASQPVLDLESFDAFVMVVPTAVDSPLGHASLDLSLSGAKCVLTHTSLLTGLSIVEPLLKPSLAPPVATHSLTRPTRKQPQVQALLHKASFSSCRVCIDLRHNTIELNTPQGNLIRASSGTIRVPLLFKQEDPLPTSTEGVVVADIEVTGISAPAAELESRSQEGQTEDDPVCFFGRLESLNATLDYDHISTQEQRGGVLSTCVTIDPAVFHFSSATAELTSDMLAIYSPLIARPKPTKDENPRPPLSEHPILENQGVDDHLGELSAFKTSLYIISVTASFSPSALHVRNPAQQHHMAVLVVDDAVVEQSIINDTKAGPNNAAEHKIDIHAQSAGACLLPEALRSAVSLDSIYAMHQHATELVASLKSSAQPCGTSRGCWVALADSTAAMSLSPDSRAIDPQSFEPLRFVEATVRAGAAAACWSLSHHMDAVPFVEGWMNAISSTGRRASGIQNKCDARQKDDGPSPSRKRALRLALLPKRVALALHVTDNTAFNLDATASRYLSLSTNLQHGPNEGPPTLSSTFKARFNTVSVSINDVRLLELESACASLSPTESCLSSQLELLRATKHAVANHDTPAACLIVEAELAKLNFPFRYDLATKLEDLKGCIKVLRNLHLEPDPPFDLDREMQQPANPQQSINVKLRIGLWRTTFEDCPLEAKLGVNFVVMQQEATEQLRRAQALDTMVQTKIQQGIMVGANELADWRRQLAARNSALYIEASKHAHASQPPPLFAVDMSGLSFSAIADSHCIGRRAVRAFARQIDESGFQHRPPSAMTEEIPYALLRARKLVLQATTMEAKFRNYALPMVQLKNTAVTGMLAFVEPAAQSEAARMDYAFEVTRGRVLQLSKTLSPLKFYHDIRWKAQSTQVAYGPCFEPAQQELSQRFDLLTAPSADPSPPLPFFDKARLLRHGPITFEAEHFTVRMLRNDDLLRLAEYLQVRSSDFVMHFGRSKADLDAEFCVEVATRLQKTPSTIGFFPRARYSCGLQWQTLGDANDHRSISLCAPQPSMSAGHDSYRMFRSSYLSMDMRVSQVVAPPAQTRQSCVTLLHTSTLSWLEQLQNDFGEPSRPIRRGRYFSERPYIKRPSLGQHLRCLTAATEAQAIASVLFSSNEEETGLWVSGTDFRLSGTFLNLPIPTNELPCSSVQTRLLSSSLRRRGRQQWQADNVDISMNRVASFALSRPTRDLASDLGLLRPRYTLAQLLKIAKAGLAKSNILINDERGDFHSGTASSPDSRGRQPALLSGAIVWLPFLTSRRYTHRIFSPARPDTRGGKDQSSTPRASSQNFQAGARPTSRAGRCSAGLKLDSGHLSPVAQTSSSRNSRSPVAVVSRLRQRTVSEGDHLSKPKARSPSVSRVRSLDETEKEARSSSDSVSSTLRARLFAEGSPVSPLSGQTFRFDDAGAGSDTHSQDMGPSETIWTHIGHMDQPRLRWNAETRKMFYCFLNIYEGRKLLNFELSASALFTEGPSEDIGDATLVSSSASADAQTSQTSMLRLESLDLGDEQSCCGDEVSDTMSSTSAADELRSLFGLESEAADSPSVSIKADDDDDALLAELESALNSDVVSHRLRIYMHWPQIVYISPMHGSRVLQASDAAVVELREHDFVYRSGRYDCKDSLRVFMTQSTCFAVMNDRESDTLQQEDQLGLVETSECARLERWSRDSGQGLWLSDCSRESLDSVITSKTNNLQLILGPSDVIFARELYHHDPDAVARISGEHMQRILAQAAHHDVVGGRKPAVNTVYVSSSSLRMSCTSEQWNTIYDINTALLAGRPDDEQKEIDTKNRDLILEAALKTDALSDHRQSVLSAQNHLRECMRDKTSVEHQLVLLDEEHKVENALNIVRGGRRPSNISSEPALTNILEQALRADRAYVQQRKQLVQELQALRSMVSDARADLHRNVEALRLAVLRLRHPNAQEQDLENQSRVVIEADRWVFHLLNKEDGSASSGSADVDTKASNESFTSSTDRKFVRAWSWSHREAHPANVEDDVEWTAAHNVAPFATAMFSRARYVSHAFPGGGTETQFEMGRVKLLNRAPGEKYPLAVARLDEGDNEGFDRSVELRVYMRESSPVGGIPVIDHLEFNAAPLVVQLSAKLNASLTAFFFDEETPSGSSDSQEPDEQQSSSAVAENGRLGNAVSDLHEMRQRATRNRAFIYVQIPSCKMCVSYKGEKEKSIIDVDKFFLRLPQFEYKNTTCTWKDLIGVYRQDVAKAVRSQAIKFKLGAGDRGLSKDKVATEAREDVRRQQLLGKAVGHKQDRSSSDSGRTSNGRSAKASGRRLLGRLGRLVRKGKTSASNLPSRVDEETADPAEATPTLERDEGTSATSPAHGDFAALSLSDDLQQASTGASLRLDDFPSIEHDDHKHLASAASRTRIQDGDTYDSSEPDSRGTEN